MDRAERIAQMYRMAQTLVRLRETGQLTREGLGRSAIMSLAAAKALEEIGNQAWELDRAGEAPELGVPAHALSGLRHRMAHVYGSVDWGIIGDVVEQDVGPLRDRLREELGEAADAVDEEVEREVGYGAGLPADARPACDPATVLPADLCYGSSVLPADMDDEDGL